MARREGGAGRAARALHGGTLRRPFGYELVESPRARFFMERSLGSRDLFPAEPDLSIRISGEVGGFRYALAVANGEPNGVVNAFPLQDPNQAKDLVARFGANVESDEVHISGRPTVGGELERGRRIARAVTIAKNGTIDYNQQPITEPELVKKFK
jgi:hypothetical protein